ncbi:MAG: acylphosphatase [Alphaproteobacteria bacterium]|nr:acylphosphatase [Alphaproteobacteria bacterium]
MKALRVLLSGRVQGVGCRVATQREAVRLGVDGFVRNLRDGRVEAWVQGEDDAVDAMVVWLGGPPAPIRVTGIAVEEAEPYEDLEGFAVAPTHGG